jgi:hypothetical protein
MSGGSLNYAYEKVESAAAEIRDRSPKSVRHLAFARHLDLVAKALHDIEWVYSCDYGSEDDVSSIQACLPLINTLDTGSQVSLSLAASQLVKEAVSNLVDHLIKGHLK